MRPAVGSISFSTVLPMVDLPQPDSPTSPSVSPLGDGEADAVDRPHLADAALQQPAMDREMLHEALDLQDGASLMRARPHALDSPSRRRCGRRRHRRPAAPRRGSARWRSRSAAAKAQPTIGRVSSGTRPGISCSRGRVPAASASTSSRGIARIRPRV